MGVRPSRTNRAWPFPYKWCHTYAPSVLSASSLVTHAGRILSTKNDLQTQVRQGSGVKNCYREQRKGDLTRSPQVDRRASKSRDQLGQALALGEEGR